MDGAKFHEIFPMSLSELERLTDSNDSAIIQGLLSAAYYDPDWRSVSDSSVTQTTAFVQMQRCVSATSLGFMGNLTLRS
jgi:hypothetical protein